MNELQSQRWVEVQFTIFVRDLFAKYPDLNTVVTLINSLHPWAEYDRLILANLIANILCDFEKYYSKRDAIILMWAAGVSIHKLRFVASTAFRTIRKWVAQYKEDPYPMRLTFTEEEREQVAKFFKAYNNIYEVKESALWISK